LCLVCESLGFVENNHLGGRLALFKEEALHAAFHEWVDFLAHRFQASLVAAIQE
jgi:hypothetical protein